MKETDKDGVVDHQLTFAPVTTQYVRVIASPEKTLPEWHGGKGKNAFLFVDEIKIDTGDVLSCTSHSGTVRHTCPIKNGEGDGLFFTVRKDKTLYKPTRWRSEALGEIPEGITRSIKGSEKERQETDAFLIDNPQDYPVAVTGKLYTLRHLSTNRDPGNFGSRIILWNAIPYPLSR